MEFDPGVGIVVADEKEPPLTIESVADAFFGDADTAGATWGS